MVGAQQVAQSLDHDSTNQSLAALVIDLTWCSIFRASDLEEHRKLPIKDTGRLLRVYFAPRFEPLCSLSLLSTFVVTPV